MRSIQVVCPVFREEEGILEFYTRLRSALAQLEDRYRFTFLFAVDPGGDRTEQVLIDAARTDARMRVLVMSRRFGHQAALMAGIDACETDALIMLDSDGQHPPELIPDIIERWEAGAQIVQTLRRDGEETGFIKRFTSALFYRLISRIGSIELKSGAADYRLLDRRVVDVIRSGLPERNMFLRGVVAWVGFRIEFIEFNPQQRLRGVSKYRPSILFNFAVQGISSFSKTPLRLCTLTGLAVAAASMLAGVALVITYFTGHRQSVAGWASLMTFVSLIGGLQLFFMGVFGEYLGQVFDEVKARPRYIVAVDSHTAADAAAPVARAEGIRNV